MTNDGIVLSWISGLRLPISTEIHQLKAPYNIPESNCYKHSMNMELSRLLEIGAIKKCNPCQDQFLSKIFLIEKENGKKRFILNLKKLNEFIPAPHFKLEDYRTAMKLISKDCFMCSIDLKDAYFSLAIDKNDRKFLRFEWLGEIYEFQVLPFGLNIAPLVFTKLMRPVMQYLRSQGFISVIYLDDLFLIGHSYLECKNNFLITKQLLESLGFTINREKSVCTPSQKIKFLGFIFDSVNFTISITDEKREKIKKEVLNYLSIQRCKVRHFAHFIGLLVSACPGVPYGWLYTKNFERTKFLCLKQNNDDYDSHLTIPKSLSEDLTWWLHNIDSCQNPIRTGNYKLEIFSDASRTGWGIKCLSDSASGQWSNTELEEHINSLELRAAFFGLKIYAKEYQNCEILLRIDNTTAIAYINRMGGIQYPHLTKISREIWQWCEQRQLFIFASYISSKENYSADAESRRIHADVEWQLSNVAFKTICEKFSKPEIDLFASRLNNKCPKFISWHRDPEAFTVDAFTISWHGYLFYAFPPFCLILRVIQKIIHDKATGIVVVPWWPTQPWFPLFRKYLVSEYIEFPPNIHLLSSPFSHEHKLQRSLTLVAGLLSGKSI